MPTHPTPPRSVALPLQREEHWTLHHVLLHRIEQETAAEDATAIDAPPVELVEAFETLDAGETRFTVAQLEAMQDVLAEYHHATTWWEIERPKLERLLHHVATSLEETQPKHVQ